MRKILAILFLLSSPAFAGNPGVIVSGSVTSGDCATFKNGYTIQDGGPACAGVGTPLAVTNGGTGTATQFTQGSVVFAGASGIYNQNNGSLFWDTTNIRLGIRTNAPTGALSVNGAAAVGSYATVSGLPTNGLVVSGLVGIGTSNPTFSLSMGGLSSQTIWMERGSSVGNNLTVQAGGGLSGGTNEVGGNLILSGGISTGTGASNVQIQGYPPATSGSTDNVAVTNLEVTGTQALFNIGSATAPGIASLVTPSNGIQIGTSNAVGIVFTVGGASQASLNFGNFFAQNSSGVLISFSTPTATNPVFQPFRSDAKAGIGANAAGNVSIIADNAGTATEMVRVQGTAVSIGTSSPGSSLTIDALSTATIGSSSLNVNGNVAIGTTFLSTAAPTNGLLVAGGVGIGTATLRNGSLLDVNGTINVGSLGSATSNQVCLGSTSNGVLSSCTQAGTGAEQTISYQPGLLSAVNATKGVFGKFVKDSTVDNIEGSAITFSCVANPTITLTNCHADTSCATSPTTIGTVTVTSAGTAFDGTISNAAILAGEYVAWSITAGTCASLDISGTAQIHAN